MGLFSVIENVFVCLSVTPCSNTIGGDWGEIILHPQCRGNRMKVHVPMEYLPTQRPDYESSNKEYSVVLNSTTQL